MELSLRKILYLLPVFFIVQSFLTTGLVTVEQPIVIDTGAIDEKIDEKPKTADIEPATRGSARASTLDFTENSTGFPSSGGYNYIAFGDFNNDGDIDVASGQENYQSSGSVGLEAYTGNGGTSWTSASTGLWTGNAWGGLQLADADEDGKMELYAADERWGTDNSSGLEVWEYHGSKWSRDTKEVSSPLPTGQPNNVILANITGDSKLDIVVALNASNGIGYWENGGGNPVNWKMRSSGLHTSGEYTAFTAVDMNKDGLKDIVAAYYSNGGQRMFIQQTSGNLWQYYNTGLTVNYPVLGVAVGDVNNDGHNDVVWGTRDNGIRCKLGNSGGGSGGTSFSWTDANTGLPTSARFAQIQLGDIDLDGDLDLIAPSGTGNSGIKIFLGNGSENPGLGFGWTTATTKNITTLGNWYGSNLYDINGDGSLDIVACSWGSGIKCYLNKLKGNLDMTPPGQITDLSVVETTTNSIKVDWSAPAQNGTNASSGPVSGYDIRYSTSNINPGNWASATQCSGEPAPASPGTTQEFNITGLNPATQYYIAIRSYDARPLTSPLSNILINSTFGLIDKTIPGKISDLAVQNPTNNSLEITWTAPADNGTDAGSGPVTAYEIRYHTAAVNNGTWSSAALWPTPPVPKTPGQSELVNITGLLPETMYYFAVKARDERPNWNYISNSPSGTTLPDPDLLPPNAITDLSVHSTGKYSINLTWTAPGNDGTLGNASVYDIRYGTAMINDGNWASAMLVLDEPVPKSQGSTEYFNVTGLSPEMLYYFAIKSGDERPNWSPLSNIASGSTQPLLDSVAPGTIDDLAADSPTESSVHLTWTAPGDDDDTGTVAGYEIRYSTASITEANWASASLAGSAPTPVSAGNGQEHTVTGLLSETTYYFAVKGYDERPNYSPLSNIASASTLVSADTTAPGAIDDLAAQALDASTVNLTWTAPGDDGATGTAAGYDIRYATVSITDGNWATALQVAGEKAPRAGGQPEYFTVKGLFANTKYYFAVKAFDEKPNYSPLSNIASATTQASADSNAPAKITDLAVESTTDTTAVLTWTAVGDDGTKGTATAYDIRYAEAEITSQSWNFAFKSAQAPVPQEAGNPEIYEVTGLDPDTTYYFAVRAADEVPNWSPVSNSPAGKTIGVAKPALAVTLTPEKTTLYGNESMELAVKVLAKLDATPIYQASVAFSADVPGIAFEPSTGETDTGGELTIDLTAPAVEKPTFITIFADVTKTAFKSNRTWVTITVMPMPADTKFNLKLSAADITFSNDTMKEGDKITIFAKIYNYGTRDASKFNVRFFIDGGQLGGDLTFNRLNRDTFVIAEIDWVATLGKHVVKVEAIPQQTDLESNSADNTAETSITVLTKEGDQPPDDKKDDKNDKESAFSPMVLGLIIVVVIIVVILVVVLLMRKKKQPAEQQMIPPPYQYPGAPGQPEYQYGYPPAVPAPPAEQVPPLAMPVGEEAQALEPAPAAEATDLPPADEEPVADEGTGTAEPVQQPEPLAAPPEEPSEPNAQAAPAQELPPEQEQVQSQTQQVQQMSACPVCGGAIPVYSTPCPQCNTELNW